MKNKTEVPAYSLRHQFALFIADWEPENPASFI